MRFQQKRRPDWEVLALGLTVAFALSTTACTDQPQGTDYYPDCPGLAPTSTADQATGRHDGSYKTTIHTFVVVGNARAWDDDLVLDRAQSPKWKATVAVGPWVSGSDRAGLGNAWSEVSNGRAMPLLSGPYGHTGALVRGVGGFDLSNGGEYACLDSQKVAYVFGTVTFEDMTKFSKPLPAGYERPDYPTPYEIQDVSLELVSGPNKEMIPESFACYVQRCGQSEKGRESEELELPIIYSYSDDNGEGGVGPQPFVIAVPNAFASDSGETLVLDSVLRLTNSGRPLERDSDQGPLGTDIPIPTDW